MSNVAAHVRVTDSLGTLSADEGVLRAAGVSDGVLTTLVDVYCPEVSTYFTVGWVAFLVTHWMSMAEGSVVAIR